MANVCTVAVNIAIGPVTPTITSGWPANSDMKTPPSAEARMTSTTPSCPSVESEITAPNVTAGPMEEKNTNRPADSVR